MITATRLLRETSHSMMTLFKELAQVSIKTSTLLLIVLYFIVNLRHITADKMSRVNTEAFPVTANQLGKLIARLWRGKCLLARMSAKMLQQSFMISSLSSKKENLQRQISNTVSVILSQFCAYHIYTYHQHKDPSEDFI